MIEIQSGNCNESEVRVSEQTGGTMECSRCNNSGYLPQMPQTTHCSCHLGNLAFSMDADPLDHHKAVRWEQACRSARVPQSGRADG